MHHTLTLIIIFLSTLPVHSQHHIFRSAYVSLPSPECYRILQDNSGFVWIATEQGVCRFDGQTTKVYGPKEGMHEKAVYALRKDERGVIWLLTKKGRVLHIRNNKVVDAGFKKLFGDAKNLTFVGYDFCLLKEHVFIPIGFSTAFRLNRKDKSYVKIRNKWPERPFIHIEHRQGQVIPLVAFNLSGVQRKIEMQYTDKDNPSENRSFTFSINGPPATQVITTKMKERVFIGVSSSLVEIGTNGETKIHPMPNRILSLYPDSRGGLWVGILGYGVRYYQNGDFSRLPVQSLPGLSVSNIMEDREQHIWCTTLEKGVYICQQPAIIAFDNFYGLDRPSGVLTADQGELLISSKRDEVIAIDSLLHIKRIALARSFGEYITAIKKRNNSWFVGYREMLQLGRRKKGVLVLRNQKEYSNVLQFGEWGAQTYILGYSKIYRYSKCKKKKIVADGLPFRARTFVVIGAAKFLVATSEELQYITVEKNGKTHIQLIGKLPETISGFFLTKKKRVFILTKGGGLYEFCNKKLTNRNKSMHIPVGVLNDMAEDRDGNLWIATNQGLLKLLWTGKEYSKPQLYDVRHGLPASVCLKLAVMKENLAVSTTDGLIMFPFARNLQPSVQPEVSFHRAIARGKVRHISNALLKYDENSLLLYFSVHSYHRNQGQRLRYTLYNGSYIQHGVSGTALSLKNLDPGNYRLRVFGQNIFGIQSSQPVIIDFIILPPFWLTWWFIVGCVVLSIAILFYAFWWIRRRTERRLEMSNNLKMQLAKSQLSTLQAQMNPHFLFNSISSIQNFIMSNRREEAYDYLTAFSRLIRRTLNNSRSQFITLAEEIETVKLYMELEQRRYNYKFDFYLELSTEIVPENILLPASLIQPLLENAIWHGVAGINTERRGEILLRISTEETDSLLITVIDNGAGIQPSDSTHKSLAIQLIEEQLLLLSGGNPEKKPNPRVQLKPAENGQGTAVCFTIPTLKKNENTISR